MESERNVQENKVERGGEREHEKGERPKRERESRKEIAKGVGISREIAISCYNFLGLKFDLDFRSSWRAALLQNLARLGA